MEGLTLKKFQTSKSLGPTTFFSNENAYLPPKLCPIPLSILVRSLDFRNLYIKNTRHHPLALSQIVLLFQYKLINNSLPKRKIDQKLN